jgi:hypothetical protein
MNEQTAASRDLWAARGRVVALPGRSHSWPGVAALVVAGTAMLATACSGGSTTAGSGADSGSGVGCGGSSLAAARVGSSSALAASHSKQLVVRYEPSQATGWKFPAATTLGGHRSCVQVSYDHMTYRISVLSFGRAGSSPNPVYEAAPADPYVAFKKTLAQAFGRHYVFRYLSGLPSGAKFVVESYSVYIDRAGKEGAKWGADLYAIYEPGKTGPAINSDVNFIQVVYNSYHPPGYGNRFVDNQYPKVPYAGEGAGLTSVNGHRIVNYYDRVMVISGPPQSQVFRAETFLVKDTGRTNAAGKRIVDIYGGIEWGFAFKTAE